MTEVFKTTTGPIMPLSNWQDKNPALVAGFTTKSGGTSKGSFDSNNLGLHVDDKADTVALNRKILADKLGFPLTSWACAEQTHQDHIVKITPELTGYGALEYKESIKGTDAFYTKETNVLLTLCYADCVPLYFYSAEQAMVGIAHAGWKGTVKNIGGKMIELWEITEDVIPAQVKVTIGPSIGECCYRVDQPVIEQVKEALQPCSFKDKFYEEISAGQFSLDLKGINRQLLLQAGVLEENIQTSTYCTSCEKDLFYSHRRDQGKTGRMLSYIGFK
ncbi:peptidoglycan editing factor PgeF [Salipaludibacillus sp. CF4.18]|uniref:peptidoglycan editing factor PgeF n=1 Tax=Salipaludibacillus sp. CF4.18 TaxID=3373081 RepID=UPI003EE6BA0D